ncbi:MAG: metal ABC transporter ATP-binding protein [Lachnospiraceae bacterium]|jgi:zinc transport system ATP-binding protein|nr:metal ABC transporter ATP-binding protein [Lachnospiraceae bacterium]
MAYITCSHLTLGYDGKTVASDLNFKVEQGDYLCIVGENGTGKSTLIKTLLGLQEKISGEMLMGDGLNPYEIGYLPQQTAVQKDFPATVWEIVLSGTLSGCGRKPFYGKAEKNLAEETMKKLGIWDLRKKCYRYLSGGQQQRALLARALCAARRVLLLDEPVAGLDPKVTTEFYQITKMLHTEGIAIIMVSHDVQAVDFAAHILHIQQENSFYGTKEEYLESDYRKLFTMQRGIES